MEQHNRLNPQAFLRWCKSPRGTIVTFEALKIKSDFVVIQTATRRGQLLQPASRQLYGLAVTRPPPPPGIVESQVVSTKDVTIVVVWLKAPTSAVADSSKWPGPMGDDVSSAGGSKFHLCSRKLFPSGLARWKGNV